MTEVLGVVLAGGLATRMGGGDKSLLSLQGRPILSHVLERLEPQVTQVVLNANGPPARFEGFGLPVIGDELTGHLGPLAGVHAAMQCARARDIPYVLSVAADTPFFPRDLLSQCMNVAESSQAPVVLASSFDATRERWMRHPTFGLWSASLCDSLETALRTGIRKIVQWTDSVGGNDARFDVPSGEIDPFFNVNTPEDLATANQWDRR